MQTTQALRVERPATRTGSVVLRTFIDAISWPEATSRLLHWGALRESRYVCICNVHSVVTATLDEQLQAALNQADMATPDGMPVAWALRRLGFATQERINGPDLMWRYLSEAERANQIVYFYGSTPETIEKLRARLDIAFPRLQIGGMFAPPFGTRSPEEDRQDVARINDSGAGVVFVGLGCPKQELWLASHRGAVEAVKGGVGAAFDYHAGTLKRAPLWMQHNGLEWLYRLLREPRRLWKRYLVTNALFLVGIFRQLVMK
jgi:N-acetylglucosaminyldiphosphoundecaprenol N-acetyl-beta-D-mannosaminyltransferase